jgi:hypothetical protein
MAFFDLEAKAGMVAGDWLRYLIQTVKGVIGYIEVQSW